MKQELRTPFDEPMGIVISSGNEPQTPPHFWAYVWAPSPEDELDEELQPA